MKLEEMNCEIQRGHAERDMEAEAESSFVNWDWAESGESIVGVDADGYFGRIVWEPEHDWPTMEVLYVHPGMEEDIAKLMVEHFLSEGDET